MDGYHARLRPQLAVVGAAEVFDGCRDLKKVDLCGDGDLDWDWDWNWISLVFLLMGGRWRQLSMSCRREA